MKLYKFFYQKDNNEKTNPNLLKFVETEKHVEGIDLTKLNEEEKKEFEKIQEEYEEKIKPYVNKGYRKYLKEKILTE